MRIGATMPEIDLLSYFTHSLTLYGPLAIGLAMLIAPFGVPIPSTPILIAAGAMVRTGALEWPSFALVMLISVVLSDCMSFAMGRYAGQRFVNNKRLSNSKIWGTARSKIRQNAAFAVVISHSLITSLGLPVNLLSGTSSYAFGRFLLWDVVGRVLWILAYGGIGLFLGSQANLLELFSGRLLPCILILAVGFLVIYKSRTIVAGWLKRIRESRSAPNGTKWAGRSVT
jgi:membrane-associated protein